MTVLGIDDTDSRSGGMCTTWIASEVSNRLPTDSVNGAYLIRLHPAVEHKTRGNGAVAIRTDATPERAMHIAATVVEEFAVHTDPETNPGVVAASDETAASAGLHIFAKAAVRTHLQRDQAMDLLAETDARTRWWGNGRGLIGATAALGAVGAHQSDVRNVVFGDWTYERIAYREPHRWGSDRSVSLPDQLPPGPAVWDTRDPVSGKPVCVPHSPCPVLFGIRGDVRSAVQWVTANTRGEPIDRVAEFITNQGTDAHIRPGEPGALDDGHAYRVQGNVVSTPTTQEGGHVSFYMEKDGEEWQCFAFSPTGRFRDTIRTLRTDDQIIACGEISEGALKLEKFGLIGRRLTCTQTPTCPDCERTMKSAGRGQGYRCRACRTSTDRRERMHADRDVQLGWYEVPPDARRHLAKPLVRGGYDLPVNPTSG